MTLPPQAGLDEVLIGVVSLRNAGPQPVTTSSRLNLLEDDLAVTVTQPNGARARAGWPWPADSGIRRVDLAPGQALESGVLLLCTSSSQPLFPVPGRYTVIAEFRPTPPQTVTSDPVAVIRTEPGGEAGRAHQRALEDRDVIQSLASASLLGAAGEAVRNLAGSGGASTAMLAALATGHARSAGRDEGTDPLGMAAALTAVLPAGVFDADDRRPIASEALARTDDERAAAMLAGRPFLSR